MLGSFGTTATAIACPGVVTRVFCSLTWERSQMACWAGSAPATNTSRCITGAPKCMHAAAPSKRGAWLSFMVMPGGTYTAQSDCEAGVPPHPQFAFHVTPRRRSVACMPHNTLWSDEQMCRGRVYNMSSSKVCGAPTLFPVECWWGCRSFRVRGCLVMGCVMHALLCSKPACC